MDFDSPFPLVTSLNMLRYHIGTIPHRAVLEYHDIYIVTACDIYFVMIWDIFAYSSVQTFPYLVFHDKKLSNFNINKA